VELREFITNGINDLTKQIVETQDKLSQLFGGRFALEQMLNALNDGVFNGNPEHETPGIEIGDLMQRIAAGEDIPDNVTSIHRGKRKKDGSEETGDANEGNDPEGDAN